MPEFLRRNAWRLSAALLVVAGVSSAFLVLRNSTSEAFPGMPPAERSYWEWVSSINRDQSTALETGFALLNEQPQLTRLYGRLAEVCIELERADECRSIFEGVALSDPTIELYREAALAHLSEGDDEAWKRIAASPYLDPTLARVVVDRARSKPESTLLTELEAEWDNLIAADSSNAGAAFGLGYAAVLRNDWNRSKPLLEHVTRVAPDDPTAFSELGRIYFFTGGYDSLIEVMEAAIDRARRSYAVEDELRFRGNLGMAYMQWKGDLEKAGEMFEAALKQATALSIGREKAFNYNRLANIRARQHRYAEALVLLDSADVAYSQYLPSRRSEVLTARGLVLKNTYRYTEAEEVLSAAHEDATSQNYVPGIAESLIGLVQARYSMGRYQSAHAGALEALEIATKYNISDYRMAARVVLGEIERLRGNYQAAEEHFTTGLALARETGSSARAIEMQRELGITALQIGDLGAAHEHFQHLLDASAASGSALERADALYWIGDTYSLYENYVRAIEAYDRAAAELGDQSAELSGLIKRNKAAALYNLGDVAGSITLLTEAAAALDGGGVQQWTVEMYMGHVHVRNGDYDEALVHFAKAEELEDELQWSAAHWYLLYGRALAEWGLGNYSRAETAFRESISLIEALRDNVRDPEDRSVFIHDKIEVYDSFASFLEGRGRNDEAFHVSERARSRTLVDLLYTTRQNGNLNLNDVADRAIELSRQVRSVERELADETLAYDATENDDVYRQNRAAYLRQEKIRSDSLYKGLQLEIFGMRRLYTFDPVVADSVYKVLSDGEVIVVYDLRNTAIIDDSPVSVVYVVSQSGVQAQPLDIELNELTESIRFFRDAIQQSAKNGKQSWHSASRKLHDVLIAPVLPMLPSGTSHVNIVPDGPLHYLPFAALADEKSRFLVERFTLSTTPSVSILKLSRERNPQRWRSMLLLADPDNRLPGARGEVLSIVEDSPGRRHALVGKDASKETFSRVASSYDVLHFATHGHFNSRAPWDSHLELYDGALTVGEIGRLSLDAYLVTLSACETALASGLLSDIPHGDEWVGLNQAFLAAGTPTVMASLWPIDDKVSSSLMVAFYEQLGPSGKAQALADVQRRFIRSAENRHPFYWAAFSVIGDPL